MWTTGAPWRVVNSLNKLNEQVRAYAPRAVPPATDVNSWGSIADNVHSVSSDHYPHYYAALGATAVVCARDFPHAPGLGLDGGVITEHMRQVRDGRVQYIIFNRRITGVNYGWQWHTYTGSDPHDTHFHVSSVHGSIADSTAQWSLPGGFSAAATPEGFDMQYIVKYTDNAATFLTDGVFARWLQDGDAVNFAMSLAKNGWNQIGNTFKNATSPTVCVLGPEQKGGTLGRIIGPVPAGFEAYAYTSAPIDVQALADAIAMELNTDSSVVVAALQSPAGQAALQSGAFAGAQQAESQ